MSLSSSDTSLCAAAPRSWTTRRAGKARRLAAVAGRLEDGVLPGARVTDVLERPGDLPYSKAASIGVRRRLAVQ